MEGLTLTVLDVKRSIDYYCHNFGFTLEWDATPQFAMLRMGGAGGATLGLLAWTEAEKEGATKTTTSQARAIHVELSTDNLDALYAALLAKGVTIEVPPHDEPWERAMTAFDPDGYSVEIAQGRRGKA
jgi:catechol 2,3-dioxygenase-like lactoylglutathione lyase family enzyme